MTLGESIRAHRLSVGMTISWLAGQLRVHRNTVTNWERGKTEPPAGQVVQIAWLTGCTVQDLLEGKNTEPVITSQRFSPGV